MAELWFIRHFRTPWNAEGRLQGRRDIAVEDPLHEDDQERLRFNRAALAGRDFALVLTSPLGRARQTAALHGHGAAQVEPALAELDMGPWEGRLLADLEVAFPGRWHDAPHTLNLGESFDAFTARVDALRARLAAMPGPVLAFGHGAWLGCLRSLLAGGDGRDMGRRGCPNGTLTRLTLHTAPVPLRTR